jgi:hypothetical protein
MFHTRSAWVHTRLAWIGKSKPLIQEPMDLTIHRERSKRL